MRYTRSKKDPGKQLRRLPRSLKPSRRIAPEGDALWQKNFSLRPSGWFLDFEDFIHTNIFHGLTDPARPANLDGSRNCFRSQAKMHTFIARRKIAACGRHGGPLRTCCRGQFYFRPNCISIASAPNEFQG